MTPNLPAPRYRALVAASGFFLSGVVGTLVGRAYSAALSTSPAWVGPVILVGSLACFVVGLLLLPAAVRGLRAKP